MRAQRAKGASGRWSLVTVIVCMEVALALRVLLMLRSGMWRDETSALAVVELPSISSMIAFLRLHESHPPLYHLILRGWLGVFGHSETAAVSLSIAAGVALVPIIYLIGRKLFDNRVGLLAAVLAAISPVLALHSVLVRPYSLLPILAVLSAWFLIEGLSRDRTGFWVGFVISTAAMLLTHHWAWLILAAEVVVVLGASSLWNTPVSRSRWLHLAAALAVIAILYGPWWTTLVFQQQHAGHRPILAPTVGDAAGLFLGVMTGLPLPHAWPAMFAIVAIGLWCIHVGMQRSPGPGTASPDPAATRRVRLTVSLLVGIPILATAAAAALSTRGNLLWVRCVQILVPLGILVIAFIVRSSDRIGRRLPAVVLLMLVGATVIWGIPTWGGIVRSNAREIARELEQKTKADDILLITPGWYGSAFNYYYKGSNFQINYPVIGRERLIRYDDLVERIADSSALIRTEFILREARGAERRVWLIMDCSWTADSFLTWKGSTKALVYPDFTRSIGLRRFLTSLYGSPVRDSTFTILPGAMEKLCPLLFRTADSEKRATTDARH